MRNSLDLYKFSYKQLRTWYEAILFLQVGVEYFHAVLVKAEINYLQTLMMNISHLTPRYLNGDTSEGEKRGSFLGLGLPELEILGLFASILDISSASFDHNHIIVNISE